MARSKTITLKLRSDCWRRWKGSSDLRGEMELRVFFLISLVLLTGVALQGATSERGAGAEVVPEIRAFTSVIDALVQVNALKRSNDPNLLSSRWPRLSHILSARQGKAVDADLSLYRAECLLFQGEVDEALATIREKPNEPPRSPDGLILYLRLGGAKTPRERKEVWGELGRILPLSSYGSQRDEWLSQTNRVAGLIDPPPPSVPNSIIDISADDKAVAPMTPGVHTIQEVLAVIGDLYEGAEFTQDAVNAYIEAFYAMPYSDNPFLRGRLWLKAGKIETSRGNKELALRAYVKAVHNWPGAAEQAKAGVAEVFDEEKPQEAQQPKPKLQSDVAMSIAALYAKLNLYPLALAALERSEKDTGEDLGSEKTRLCGEWADILGKIAQVRGQESYVLGQKVSEVRAWDRMPILRPTDTFWK